MRAHHTLPLVILPLLVAGCNTPPIPPGKSVDIPTAMEQVLAGLCSFKKDLAAHKQDWGVAVDSVTVELDLTIDATKIRRWRLRRISSSFRPSATDRSSRRPKEAGSC